jgi:hypothetical protein
MPMTPLAQDLHIDHFLTNISIQYRNPQYVADDLFPIVPVQKQSDVVPKYLQSAFFRDDAALRAPGTKSQGGGFLIDQALHYFSDRYSFRFEITDEQRDNTDAPFDLDADGAIFAADKCLMRRERNFASTFFTPGVWNGGSDQVGGTNFVQWSNFAGSQPLVDLVTNMDIVEGNIAREGNVAIMGKQVWLQLKWHPDIIDTVKYTKTGKASTDLVIELTDLTKLIVGRGLYTTSAEGTAEASVVYSRIWGKNVLVMYVPDSASIRTPAAGYTFVWQRVASAGQYIKRFRDEERETDIIEANTYFGQTLVNGLAGSFLSAAVA